MQDSVASKTPQHLDDVKEKALALKKNPRGSIGEIAFEHTIHRPLYSSRPASAERLPLGLLLPYEREGWREGPHEELG
jgi:hypothetical protein